VLPGCDFVSGLSLFMCRFSTDDAHCFQDAAVQSGDSANCDKVSQKEEFKKVGSNPPQDKCRMMIAANKEDPALCKTLKGGMMSYSPEDCEATVAEVATKPDTCTAMSGSAAGKCADTVADKTFAEVDALVAKSNKTPDEIAALQKKMSDLGRLTEMMSGVMKADYDAKQALIGNLR
jgi:hypothetical protein